MRKGPRESEDRELRGAWLIKEKGLPFLGDVSCCAEKKLLMSLAGSSF